METPSNEEWRWVGPFFVVTVLNSVTSSALGTIFGPAQPFIAENIGEDIASINFVHFFGHMSSLAGTLVSSLTFKQYVTKSSWKLLVLGFGSLFVSLMSFFIPLAKSFQILILIFVVRDFVWSFHGLGAQGMYVYTLGPVKSRHLVMAHHFSVGIGFVIGPFLIGKFLNQGLVSKVQEEICEPSSNFQNSTDSSEILSDPIDIITPFHILTGLMVVTNLMYFCLLFLPHKMPVYEEYEKELRTSKIPPVECNNSNLFVAVMITLFYFSSCSSERIFQSMAFTFGMCGPLSLAPSEAVITDEMYNIGFMSGRFLSIFAVHAIKPMWMLRISLLLCLVASTFMAMTANISPHYLYAWALLFGLSLSWQYGSMYSWCAEKLDIVGWRASLFSVGCGLGGALSPPLSGILFKSVNPMDVWYLNVISVFLQIFATVCLTIHFKNHPNLEADSGKSHVKYNLVSQDDDEDISKEELDLNFD